MPGAGWRTQVHCGPSVAPLNSSDSRAIRLPGSVGLGELRRVVGVLAGLGRGGRHVGCPRPSCPPRTVGQPSTQSSGSISTGRLVKPTAPGEVRVVAVDGMVEDPVLAVEVGEDGVVARCRPSGCRSCR